MFVLILIQLICIIFFLKWSFWADEIDNKSPLKSKIKTIKCVLCYEAAKLNGKISATIFFLTLLSLSCYFETYSHIYKIMFATPMDLKCHLCRLPLKSCLNLSQLSIISSCFFNPHLATYYKQIGLDIQVYNFWYVDVLDKNHFVSPLAQCLY